MSTAKSLTKSLLLVSLTAFLFVSPLEAHEEDTTPGKSSNEVLGKVHFVTSCSPAVERSFNRAVALLHSFWYAEAEKAFAEVASTDSGCAMAHWGVAMTYFHPLWAPPTPVDLKNGSAAAERAVSVGAKTERERDYIQAIRIFYQDSDKLDHKTRAKAYEKAMEQVYLRNPDDKEAAIFYALALDATAPETDKTYAQQRKAGGILKSWRRNCRTIRASPTTLFTATTSRHWRLSVCPPRAVTPGSPNRPRMRCTCHRISSPVWACGMSRFPPTWHPRRRRRTT